MSFNVGAHFVPKENDGALGLALAAWRRLWVAFGRRERSLKLVGGAPWKQDWSGFCPGCLDF
jgi:hypothetical protein